MGKRIVSLLLAVIVFVSVVTVPSFVSATSPLSDLSGYSLTGDPATDIVRVAKAQVGKTGSQLGAKEDWCADFVFSCARAAGIGDNVIPTTGGVSNMLSMFTSRGGTVVSSPRAGDIVFYGTSHVAIMTDSVNSVHGNIYNNGAQNFYQSQVWSGNYTYYRDQYNNLPKITFIRPNYSQKPVEYKITFSNFTGPDYHGQTSYVSDTEVKVVATISASGYLIYDVGTVGIDVYRDGVWVGGKSETPQVSPSGNICAYYTMRDELKINLTDGNYTYRFYAVAGGNKFYSQELSFTFGNPNKVTISFDPVLGNVSPTSKDVTYGETYGELPVPTKTGYVFAGWSDGEKIVGSGTPVPDNDITLRAEWTAEKYTVTFEPNLTAGGSLEFETKEVTFNEKYGILPKVTRKGSTFRGWYSKNVEGTLITEETAVNTPSDHTLYAYWDINTYKIHFDASGGEVNKEYHEVIYRGRYNASGRLPVAAKDGYRFLGWATDKNGGSFIMDNDVFTGEEDMTVYAVWVSDSAELSEIIVDTSEMKTKYNYGEEFSSEGLKITAKYSDGTVITTKNGFDISSADTTVIGDIPVSIVFDGKSAYFGITVLPKPDEVIGIEKIHSMPEKTVYTVGEKFDANGFVLKVILDGGKTKLVDTGITFTGYDTDTPGIKNVTAEYEGYTVVFIITVEEKPLPEISYLKGDANLSGDVSAADATQILRHINGKTSAIDSMTADERLSVCDVNGDGDVSAADATQILRHVNGKSSMLDN